MNKIKLFFGSFLLMLTSINYGQITVENTSTPEELVETVLVGAGVTVSNIEFNHSIPLAGTVQTQVGYFNAESTSFPIAEGLILATGHTRLAVGPNNSASATDNDGVATDPNDTDLNAIGTTEINNEAILEFDFVPSGDSVVFKYIFASEEYHEFSTSSFNDVFGFFISGPGFAGPYEDGGVNIALIPGAGIPVSMNNLNNGTTNTGPCTNCEFLVDNTSGTDIQYDGHTVPLFAAAQVVCGETYHIKMAIGDASDFSLDSGVFLEASSFSSNGITVEIASVLGEDAIIEGCDSALVSFIRPEESDSVELTIEYGIGGTATNGTDYAALDGSVFFPTGTDTVQFWIVPIDDGIADSPETVEITVEIVNECGDTITTTATIEIVDKQPYTVSMTDIVLDCPQDSVALNYTTEGGIPAFSTVWSTGETNAEEWVPGNIEGTSTYTVNLTDQCGVEASGTVDVTFDPAPVVSITFNQDLFIICPGQEATVDATLSNVYNADEVTYNWSPTGETTEDIVVTPGAPGWQYLTVFDGCNTVTDSVKIEFGEIDLTSITVVDATDCPGQPSAVLGSITVLPNNPAWAYELVGYVPPQDNGNFIDLTGGIDYLLKITDENGCTTDTIVPVGLGENEVTAIWEEDSLRAISCFGANDGGAYIYNINGGITPPFDVKWINPAGVFATETVSAGGNSEHDDLGPGGSWVVTVVDQEGCAWSHNFELTEPDLLTIDISFNNPTCYQFSDGSVTVNATGGNDGKIYEIRNEDGELENVSNSNTANSLPQGTYTVTVTDEKGCSATGSATLTHPDELNIDLTVNQPLCYGFPTGTAIVDSVYNATGDLDSTEYYWTPNPLGEEGNGIGKNEVIKMGEGEYTLTINDDNGCSKIFDFTIAYPPKLEWAINADGSSGFGYEPAFCRTKGYQSGGGVVYAAATGGTPDYTTPEWTYLVDGTTASQGTWGGRNPGLYAVLVKDENGCELRDTIRVDSLNPIAAFTIKSDQLNSDCQGTADVEVEFTNTSQNYQNPNDPSSEYRFFWNLDKENVTDWTIVDEYTFKPDTIYKARGNSYIAEVCLVAQNYNNCVDTACKKIEIFEPIKFVNVNIFSPNGDGINDEFTFNFYAKSISKFNCVIMNRWGIKVAEMNNISDSWDGTDMSGSPCNDGVYFYKYSATSDNGTTLEGQGNIQIIDSNP